MTTLSAALQAILNVNFSVAAPKELQTVGDFLERAALECVQREDAVTAREVQVSAREQKVQLSEEKVAAELATLASIAKVRGTINKKVERFSWFGKKAA